VSLEESPTFINTVFRSVARIRNLIWVCKKKGTGAVVGWISEGTTARGWGSWVQALGEGGRGSMGWSVRNFLKGNHSAEAKTKRGRGSMQKVGYRWT